MAYLLPKMGGITYARHNIVGEQSREVSLPALSIVHIPLWTMDESQLEQNNCELPADNDREALVLT
jgi:hypothetical protein